MIRRILGLVAILGMLLALIVSQSTAQDDADEEALIERGEYLIHIGGCISCHTPPKEEFADMAALKPEQLAQVGLEALETLDLENKLLAGGRPFDLGPAGLLYTRNLTPDKETGLGDWTDAEIENAIRIGVSRDGRRLHPVMPYLSYYGLATEDMQAIIAYLRSIPAVENEVEDTGLTGEGIAPELILPEELPATAPQDDPVALGEYLVRQVMVCGDCHTPLDENTGAPMVETHLLAGGQPYEGPWGIVYGGNITPHEVTGIGEWTDEEITRVIREGVRTDGRRLVLMPWEDYAVITDDDLAGVIAYLRSIPAVDNEIPAPAIEDLFLAYTEE
jgi:mono/diheme cytochrome c family protein